MLYSSARWEGSLKQIPSPRTCVAPELFKSSTGDVLFDYSNVFQQKLSGYKLSCLRIQHVTLIVSYC